MFHLWFDFCFLSEFSARKMWSIQKSFMQYWVWFDRNWRKSLDMEKLVRQNEVKMEFVFTTTGWWFLSNLHVFYWHSRMISLVSCPLYWLFIFFISSRWGTSSLACLSINNFSNWQKKPRKLVFGLLLPFFNLRLRSVSTRKGIVWVWSLVWILIQKGFFWFC